MHVSLPQQWQRSQEIRSLMAQIPAEASVSTTTQIVPHLSGRRAIIRLPGLEFRNDNREVVKVDYALADLWRLQQYQVAFKHDRNRLGDITRKIDEVTDAGEYGIVGFKNGVVLLQQGATDEVEAREQWLVYRQELGVEK